MVPATETCDRPPAGWRCTRQPGHKGPCAAIPTRKAATVYVPTEALMRLRLASERSHIGRRHHGVWESCTVETCSRDRIYLGQHGIVDVTGRKLR